jgi:uncharacterized YigZ family protein
VSTEEEAVAFIAEIRSKHWDARHNVYAYSLRKGNLSRYSDDGEPSGTAGLPVLDVITKNGVTDVCVVVTRYFGGVLLGKGGLVRAYAQGAKLALAAGGVITMQSCRLCSLCCNYNQYGKVSATVMRQAALSMKHYMKQRSSFAFTSNPIYFRSLINSLPMRLPAQCKRTEQMKNILFLNNNRGITRICA